MILVTGGSGYVGSHIVKRLVGDGKPIRVLVRDIAFARQESRLHGLEIDWIEGDVTTPETLYPALDGTSAVIHTVAIAIEKGRGTYESVNAQGTMNLIKATEAAQVSRFINLSQLGADAHLPYRFLASKGLAQEYVASSTLDWTSFRPAVIWGPEDEFANSFARLVPFSPIIFPIVDKHAQFQPVWVEDVATCVTKALDAPATIHQEYELGGPEILTLEEIERRTLKSIGANRTFISTPRWMIKAIVALMEALLPNPPVTRSLLELLSVSNVTQDNAIAKFVENPRPFTAENASAYMQEFNFRDTLAQFFQS